MLSAERLERILGCPCGWRGGPVPCEAPTRRGGQPDLFRWPLRKSRGRVLSAVSWHLLCADLLYTFKAARRAARAADTARTPPLPLALPLRRRQRRSAGAKTISPRAATTYSSHRGSQGEQACLLPLSALSESGRTRQERLRRRLRRSSTLDRTCPKRNSQLSGSRAEADKSATAIACRGCAWSARAQMRSTPVQA